MKSAVLLLACVFLTVTAVHGKTKYVTDVFEVMVRTGPDLSHKINLKKQFVLSFQVQELTAPWERKR